MKALVVYASKYGSTKGIAEFVSEKLGQLGMMAEVQRAEAVRDLGDYDIFVIGSAAYMGHWLKEATEFVKRNRVVLAKRPVWLFSSGPLVIVKMNPGRGLEDAVPKEIADFNGLIHPRDHRVFLGKLDSSKLNMIQRMMAKLPAAHALFPEGDFRDWSEIEAWAIGIAQTLEFPQIQSDDQA